MTMTDSELNEAVARKLGFEHLREEIGASAMTRELYGTDRKDGIRRIILDYCHSIEAAWEIVEKFVTESGWDFNLLGGERYGGDWQANFSGHDQWHSAEADTAPRAICLAFLKLL